MGSINITSKDRKHIFPIIFYARHVQMENAYIFNVYPVDWKTEIIPGRANLLGNGSIEYFVENRIFDIQTETIPEKDVYLYLNMNTTARLYFYNPIYFSASAVVQEG